MKKFLKILVILSIVIVMFMLSGCIGIGLFYANRDFDDISGHYLGNLIKDKNSSYDIEAYVIKGDATMRGYIEFESDSLKILNTTTYAHRDKKKIYASDKNISLEGIIYENKLEGTITINDSEKYDFILNKE